MVIIVRLSLLIFMVACFFLFLRDDWVAIQKVCMQVWPAFFKGCFSYLWTHLHRLFAFLIICYLNELWLVEFARCRSHVFVGVKAFADEFINVRIFHSGEGHGRFTWRDLLVNLRRAQTFFVRSWLRNHLKHTHAKGINVYFDVIVLFI